MSTLQSQTAVPTPNGHLTVDGVADADRENRDWAEALGPLPDTRRTMAIGQNISSALDALRSNKLRSVLTMLGIIIGVAAVIVMIALGEGARQSVQDRLSQLGTNTLTLLLAGVGSISLLVGGIGIMNIMLVSVTERTREIGIRMAVGARPVNILSQFLIEAILLSGTGGFVGIGVGTVVSATLGRITANLQPVISPGAVVLSFGFAALVGIFFGFYPARRASRLDPVEALRYE